MEKWHKQETDDLWDFPFYWDISYFVIKTKDGKFHIVYGMLDENCDGEIFQHLIYTETSDEVNYDDIEYWIELPFDENVLK